MHPRAEIVRYVADGLPADAEREVRAHIASCPSCKAFYDEERLLHRALGGDVSRPTTREVDAVVARALYAVAAAPEPRQAAQRARRRWFVSPVFLASAASAIALVVFVVVGRERNEPVASAPPALAGRATHVHGATLNGVDLLDGAQIHAFDSVRVSTDGVLELAVERGGTVRAFPNTSFSLSRRGEVVALERGKVWCVVDKQKGDFAVITKEAVVRVLGTSFIVDERSDGTDVRVVSGNVRVSDAAEHGSVTLKSEEGSHVAANKAPSVPRRVSTAADVSEWQLFFERLIEQLGEAVRQLGEKLKIGR